VQQKEKPKLPSLLGKKVWLPTAEWETIKEAINGTTNIPLDTPRNILMGYQYALHPQGKRVLQEREIITTQCASASAASRAAREECMNASYTNSGRHHKCGSRMDNMDYGDRSNLARNIKSSFISVDD
jgi:hypothetical protein